MKTEQTKTRRMSRLAAVLALAAAAACGTGEVTAPQPDVRPVMDGGGFIGSGGGTGGSGSGGTTNGGTCTTACNGDGGGFIGSGG